MLAQRALGLDVHGLVEIGLALLRAAALIAADAARRARALLGFGRGRW
ncbi:hypothetical protein ACFFTK_26960 [Pseudonocardia petroleophila]|uniref:Uncharacterized protein n=1 Tax=Pseudonocardia petroleophila TaxID=37331 RepID=A0A7G7MGR6_9PSEU|nr:hypothetical protein [Pseudonocardia petroleophila]QNG51977.1 hypothetical protein H6H00_28495 [Pseudonocardia petroleophila]